MNVTYPLVPEEIVAFCAGKRAVLVVEEGQPAYLEEAILATPAPRRGPRGQGARQGRPADGRRVHRRGRAHRHGALPRARRRIDARRMRADRRLEAPKSGRELLGAPLPARPPGFCVGCPERPVFAAMKLVERDVGKFHVSADIGCHTFSTLPPFNIGNTVLGYGLGLASNSGVSPDVRQAHASPSWATAASGTTASPRASRTPSSTRTTASSSS